MKPPEPSGLKVTVDPSSWVIVTLPAESVASDMP